MNVPVEDMMYAPLIELRPDHFVNKAAVSEAVRQKPGPPDAYDQVVMSSCKTRARDVVSLFLFRDCHSLLIVYMLSVLSYPSSFVSIGNPSRRKHQPGVA